MKLFGNKNMQFWELLIQGYPENGVKYTELDWKNMVDGLIESFNKYTGIPFSCFVPYRFSLNQNDPCVGFDLIHKISTPLYPLVYYVKGCVETYHFDNGEKEIFVSLFLFLYFGKTRLLGENINETRNDDCILFEYKIEQQSSYWNCAGWNAGYLCEWDGLKYPDMSVAHPMKIEGSDDYKYC